MKTVRQYDIVTSVELEGGLAKMCNLSDYIEEKALEKGRMEALAEQQKKLTEKVRIKLQKER